MQMHVYKLVLLVDYAAFLKAERVGRRENVDKGFVNQFTRFLLLIFIISLSLAV